MKKRYHIHYSHPDGRKIGDVMPFYFDGSFHVFYLLNGSGHDDINHEHVVSSDLVNWKYVGPSIRHEDNCAFTGSYLQTIDGRFHCFFTRWNPDDPFGRETIGHAFSSDLTEWTKTAPHLVPDGKFYSKARYRDFRDPCVFFNHKDSTYHMLLLANAPTKENTSSSWDENWIQGHYSSKDLISWVPEAPLCGNFADECPDYFYKNGVHYIHGCHRYAISEDDMFGPYNSKDIYILDKGLRAAKTCFVGNRLFWVGGFIGGSMTLPREIVFLESKMLGVKIPEEIINKSGCLISRFVTKHQVFDLDDTLAYRLHVADGDFLDATISINDGDLIIIRNSGYIRIKTKEKSINLENNNRKWVAIEMDLIIDGDLVELYWDKRGAYTHNNQKAIQKISFSFQKDHAIDLFKF